MKEIRRSIPINDRLWDRLKAQAKKEGVSVSYMVRLACTLALNKLEENSLEERLMYEHINNDKR